MDNITASQHHIDDVRGIECNRIISQLKNENKKLKTVIEAAGEEDYLGCFEIICAYIDGQAQDDGDKMNLCLECKQDKAITNHGLCLSCNEGTIEDMACDIIKYRKRAEEAEKRLPDWRCKRERRIRDLEQALESMSFQDGCSWCEENDKIKEKLND